MNLPDLSCSFLNWGQRAISKGNLGTESNLAVCEIALCPQFGNSIRQFAKRIKKAGDLFEPVLSDKQDIRHLVRALRGE
jgi:hypothetical protein